jgi:GNAT superfamily N-acetyltransferase
MLEEIMDDYTFKVVLFNELDELDVKHPNVVSIFGGSTDVIKMFEPLRKCPDIYDAFPVFFYLEHKDKLVSYLACLPDILSIGDQEYKWSWGGGLYSNPNYRGKGLATNLIDNMVKLLHEKNIGWAGVFSVPAAVHIYKKLGFTVPGYVDRFIYLKSCKPIIHKFIRIKTLGSICDIVFKPISKLVWHIKKDRSIDINHDYQLNHIQDIDQFKHPEKSSLKYFSAFHFNDSSEKLIYKIKHNSNLDLYNIYSKEQQKTILYFVLNNRYLSRPLGGFSDFRLMTLMDYGFYSNDDPNYFKVLIHHVFKLFYESDAEALDIISSYGFLSGLLKSKWMIKIGKGMSYKFAAPTNWDLGDEAKQIESWHLTHFCGDAYAFE